MPKDPRRDSLKWRKKKPNHGVKPGRGRRGSDFKFGDRASKGR